MTRMVFVLVLCFSSLCANAQNILDVAHHETLRLQYEGVDTIVSFGKLRIRFSDPETSKQLGEIAVEESVFIFYKSKGNAFVERCMSFGDSTGRFGNYATSKPMMVAADSMLKWVAGDAEKISSQPICGYIFEQKADSTNTVYDLYADHHPIRILIWIHIKEDKPGIGFSLGDLDYLYSVYAPENLNYLYNIKTPAYKLFSMLEKIADSVKNDLRY